MRASKHNDFQNHQRRMRSSGAQKAIDRACHITTTQITDSSYHETKAQAVGSRKGLKRIKRVLTRRQVAVAGGEGGDWSEQHCKEMLQSRHLILVYSISTIILACDRVFTFFCSKSEDESPLLAPLWSHGQTGAKWNARLYLLPHLASIATKKLSARLQ